MNILSTFSLSAPGDFFADPGLLRGGEASLLTGLVNFPGVVDFFVGLEFLTGVEIFFLGLGQLIFGTFLGELSFPGVVGLFLGLCRLGLTTFLVGLAFSSSSIVTEFNSL